MSSVAVRLQHQLVRWSTRRRLRWGTDPVVAYECNEPFAVLIAAHGATGGRGLLRVDSSPPETASRETDPGPYNGRSVAARNRVYKRTSPSLLARAYSVPSLKATHLAERVGFEPTDRITTVNALAGRPIRPLWHLSRGGPQCTRIASLAERWQSGRMHPP